MKGLRVLVTAGPTQESIDPVRYITNHSTGKMGYAIAKVCMQRGADVTLVTGPTSIEKPQFVNVVPITTAREMFEEVTGRAEEQDIIIKAAAVADYRPRYVSDEKVKKRTMIWHLRWNAQMIFWHILALIKRKVSSSVDFLWKQKICSKIPERS